MMPRYFFLILLLNLFAITAQGAVIREILVHSLDGETTVDPESVLAFVRIEVGEELDASLLSADLKTIEKTGRYSFATVDIEPRGEDLAVVFTVDPKLRLKELTFKGFDKFSDRKIRKTLALEAGDLVDEATIVNRLRLLEKEYEDKYFSNVRIDYQIDKYPALGQADVHLEINEGDKTKVRGILFEGNTTITSWRLRKIMEQKKINVLSWLTGSGKFNKDALERDLLTLRDAYRDLGYLDVEIGNPHLRQINKSKIDIVVPIVEGSLFYIRNVSLKGATLFPEDDLYGLMALEPGDEADLVSLNQVSDRVRKHYSKKGYFGTRVDYDLSGVSGRPAVDVEMSVKEGKLTSIRDIRIVGNSRTKDKVIRRELAIYPGDVLNEDRIRLSEARLKNLGYFSFVNASYIPTGRDDELDVRFEVEEDKTGQFVAGAGFSSIDNLIGFIELSQGNFDALGFPYFTGGGQKMKVRAQLGTSRRDLEFSYIQPWFLDRKLSLGFDVFQHERRFFSDDYDQRNTGARISLSKSLAPFWRGRLSYELEQIDVFDVSTNASAIILLEEGASTQSSLELSFIRDTRNKVFVPTQGSRVVLSGKLAGGPLGADVDLYQLQLKAAEYFPLWFDHIFTLRGWYQIVEEYGDSKRVPIFDRLFVGGARTVRGFSFRDIGPRDERGEPIGGKSSFYTTAEYTVPITPQLRLATFYDVGMVYRDSYTLDFGDINSSYGIGARIDIPGFPLQLDYSWPLEADTFNDRNSGRFSFLIGYTF